MALLLCSPLTAAAAGTDPTRAFGDAADGLGDVGATVEEAVKSGTETVDATVATTAQTVTKAVEQTNATTSDTLEKTVKSGTETVDATVAPTTQTVTKAADAVKDTVEATSVSTAAGGDGSTRQSPAEPWPQATSTAAPEPPPQPGDDKQAAYGGYGASSASGTATEHAEASASDDQPGAGGPPVRSAAAPLGLPSMTPDRVAAQQAAAAGDPPDTLFATVRIRGGDAPFVAAVEIDTNGRELLVRLRPVDRSPLPDPDDDRGATSEFEATVAVASGKPFQATVRFVVRDDGLVLLVDPTETPGIGVTEVLSEVVGRLAATGLHMLPLAGVGVALVTAGWASVASTNRRRRGPLQTPVQAGQSAALSHGDRGASPRRLSLRWRPYPSAPRTSRLPVRSAAVPPARR